MDEKEFWIDFSASLKVTAKNADEAKDYFWRLSTNDFLGELNLNFIEIDSIEEAKE